MSEQHVAGGVPQDEEPKTPMWLPAVGAALFVGLALWWAVTPPAVSPTAAEPAASASAAAAPNPQALVPQPVQPGAVPSPSGQQARMPVPSALPADMKKRLDDLRGKLHH